MIGLVALIAVPTAAKAMRERRSSQAAQEVAQLINQARSRAIARGSAVLVRYNHTTGGFEVREAIAGASGVGNCELAPAASCTVPANRWEDGSTFSQQLSTFRPLGTSAYEMVDFQFLEFDYAGGVVNDSTRDAVDLCMTPGGQIFYRPDNNSSTAFQPMIGNHAVKVWMRDGTTTIGVERLVYILPSGVARVGT